jgi:hypothetical protein
MAVVLSPRTPVREYLTLRDFPFTRYVQTLRLTKQAVGTRLGLNYYSLLRWEKDGVWPRAVWYRMVAIWGDAGIKVGKPVKAFKPFRLNPEYEPYTHDQPPTSDGPPTRAEPTAPAAPAAPAAPTSVVFGNRGRKEEPRPEPERPPAVAERLAQDEPVITEDGTGRLVANEAFFRDMGVTATSVPAPVVAPPVAPPTAQQVQTLQSATPEQWRAALEVLFGMMATAQRERAAAFQIAERYKALSFDLESQVKRAQAERAGLERRITDLEDEVRLANQLLTSAEGHVTSPTGAAPTGAAAQPIAQEVEELVRAAAASTAPTAGVSILDDLEALLPKATGLR